MQETTKVQVPDSVTICITSCGRLDLLDRTLESFRRFNAGGRYIISEDSTLPHVIAEVARKYPEMQLLHGPDRLGITRSIDRLYDAVTTPYVFHLEDDWQFVGPVDWQAAIDVLETRPDIVNVCVRSFKEIRLRFRLQSKPLRSGGKHLRVMNRSSHPEFFAWSPNPGLIKLELHRQYGPFGRYYPDEVSAVMKRDGKTMAFMLPGVAMHIGHGRNVVDPTMPARPKSYPLKWLRAIKKQLYYAGLRKEPF